MHSDPSDLNLIARVQMAGDEVFPESWVGVSPMRLAFAGEGFSAESRIDFEPEACLILPNGIYSTKILVAFGDRLRSNITPGTEFQLKVGSRVYARGEVLQVLPA